MPNFQTAKKTAENALSIIGAFPSSQSSPDPGDLRKALIWLEMILNFQSGKQPLAGFWRIVDIPVQATVGDYPLSDYVNTAEAQHVFSVSLVDANGDPDPLDMLFENDSAIENLSDTGTPDRVCITKDVKPIMKIFPTPVQSNEDSGQVLRLRIQTYHEGIDPTGNADIDLGLRPAWYLWITKRLAYEIACGPVYKLPEGELRRLESDADKLEDDLSARDNQYNSAFPPRTEVYGSSVT